MQIPTEARENAQTREKRLDVSALKFSEDQASVADPSKGGLTLKGITFPSGDAKVPETGVFDHAAQVADSSTRISSMGMNRISRGPGREHVHVKARREILVENEQEKHVRILLDRLKRPKGWPQMVAFPPREILDACRKEPFKEDEMRSLEKYFEHLGMKTDEHRQRLDAWFKTFENRGAIERVISYRSRKEMERGREADSYDTSNIMWASLLDVTAANVTAHQSVKTWGRDTVEMIDGGILHAKKDEISVLKGSNGVAALMVGEAKARGWDSLKVEGTEKFCEALIQAAKDAKIPAEVTIVKKTFGFTHKKTIFVTPDVPYNQADIEDLKKKAGDIRKANTPERKILDKAIEDDRRSKMSPEEKHAEDEAAEREARRSAEKVASDRRRAPDPGRQKPANSPKRRKEAPALGMASEMPDPSSLGDPGPQPDDRYVDGLGYDEADIAYSAVPLGYEEAPARNDGDDDDLRMG